MSSLLRAAPIARLVLLALAASLLTQPTQALVTDCSVSSTITTSSETYRFAACTTPSITIGPLTDAVVELSSMTTSISLVGPIKNTVINVSSSTLNAVRAHSGLLDLTMNVVDTTSSMVGGFTTAGVYDFTAASDASTVVLTITGGSQRRQCTTSAVVCALVATGGSGAGFVSVALDSTTIEMVGVGNTVVVTVAGSVASASVAVTNSTVDVATVATAFAGLAYQLATSITSLQVALTSSTLTITGGASVVVVASEDLTGVDTVSLTAHDSTTTLRATGTAGDMPAAAMLLNNITTGVTFRSVNCVWDIASASMALLLQGDGLPAVAATVEGGNITATSSGDSFAGIVGVGTSSQSITVTVSNAVVSLSCPGATGNMAPVHAALLAGVMGTHTSGVLVVTGSSITVSVSAAVGASIAFGNFVAADVTVRDSSLRLSGSATSAVVETQAPMVMSMYGPTPGVDAKSVIVAVSRSVITGASSLLRVPNPKMLGAIQLTAHAVVLKDGPSVGGAAYPTGLAVIAATGPSLTVTATALHALVDTTLVIIDQAQLASVALLLQNVSAPRMTAAAIEATLPPAAMCFATSAVNITVVNSRLGAALSTAMALVHSTNTTHDCSAATFDAEVSGTAMLGFSGVGDAGFSAAKSSVTVRCSTADAEPLNVTQITGLTTAGVIVRALTDAAYGRPSCAPTTTAVPTTTTTTAAPTTTAAAATTTPTTAAAVSTPLPPPPPTATKTPSTQATTAAASTTTMTQPATNVTSPAVLQSTSTSPAPTPTFDGNTTSAAATATTTAPAPTNTGSVVAPIVTTPPRRFTLRLSGNSWPALLIAAESELRVRTAVTNDLAKALGVANTTITIHSMIVGSLIVDASVDTSGDNTAVAALNMSAALANASAFNSTATVYNKAVPDETISVLSVTDVLPAPTSDSEEGSASDDILFEGCGISCTTLIIGIILVVFAVFAGGIVVLTHRSIAADEEDEDTPESSDHRYRVSRGSRSGVDMMDMESVGDVPAYAWSYDPAAVPTEPKLREDSRNSSTRNSSVNTNRVTIRMPDESVRRPGADTQSSHNGSDGDGEGAWIESVHDDNEDLDDDDADAGITMSPAMVVSLGASPLHAASPLEATSAIPLAAGGAVFDEAAAESPFCPSLRV